MNLEEKLRIAEVLEEMGVDVIEAGFPIASTGDFEAVHEIAKQVKTSTVCGLARAVRGDIDRVAEALKPAPRGAHPHLHLHQPAAHEVQAADGAGSGLSSASSTASPTRGSFTDDVEWSCEDGSRTEHDFLCRCVEAAIKAGARTINIPDTVGYAMPEEFAALIAMLRNRVPNIDKAIISVHCHNDLGLAVANSLAAVAAGARQVECTINGLGERAGNAALEEIVMALRTRHDRMPLQHRRQDREHHAGLAPGLGHHRLRRPAEQGDRRRQRLRARIRHPPGRHAEARRHLRDHDAGVGRPVQARTW